MPKDINTESKIIAAANRIFMKNGWSGARMQDIADEAKINKAMLHYYFRNKEQLFQIVFREKAKSLIQNVFKTIPQASDLDEMIPLFVDRYISFLSETPELPLFVINEVWRHPELLDELFPSEFPEIFLQFQNAMERGALDGRYRRIPIQQVFINMVSLCIFPMLAKPVFKKLFHQSDTSFDQLIEDRKKTIAQTILNDIKIK